MDRINEPMIFQSPRHLWQSSLDLLLTDVPKPERETIIMRFLHKAVQQEHFFSGLHVALSAGKLIGAVWVQLQPGRTASLWFPKVLPSVSPELSTQVQSRLIQTAIQFSQQQGCKYLQLLLGTHASEELTIVEQLGFKQVTEIVSMLATTQSLPKILVASPLRFQAVTTDDFAQLISVVDSTFQDTCDCPRLNGILSADEAVANYRQAGEAGIDLWSLAFEGDRAVGCLLLADQPAEESLELVYLGLIPEVRGRQLGQCLVHEALLQAHRAGRKKLLLGVDVNNQPAFDLYVDAGFVAWYRQLALVRLFPMSGSETSAKL